MPELASSLAPCAYRRVHRGQMLCTRAKDEFDRSVWAEVCARCPVPAWLEAGVCRHLDVGTEVGRRLAAETPRVFTACRHFGITLDGLDRCSTCPEFSLWEEEKEEEQEIPPDLKELAESLPRELLEQAVREALDRHMREQDVRMMPRCFRAGAVQCLRSPRLIENWVLIVPPPSLRQVDPYRSLIGEVLKEGGLEGIIFSGLLEDVDSLCDLCLIVQQCPRLVVDVSEWDAGALFALALGGALGRWTLMIRGKDTTPPFVPQGLPVHEYGTGQDLAMLLVGALGIRLQPAEEKPAGPPPPPEGEKKAEEPPGAEQPAEEKETTPEQPAPAGEKGAMPKAPASRPRKRRKKPQEGEA